MARSASLRLSTGAAGESEVGGGLEAPPGEMLRADAAYDSEVGNSLEAPPGEIMELRADAVDESEAGGSLEAPPGELMELAISFHTKGSMYRFLEEVRSRIQDMLQRLQADIPGEIYSRAHY